MRMLFVPKIKKNRKEKEEKRRMLISVKVVGSAGPIRFIVNEDDVVADVIGRTLQIYASQGRLPVLGSDVNDFQLFSIDAESKCLDARETIGWCGARNFMLWKKPDQLKTTGSDNGIKKGVPGKVGTGALKSWINKSLKIVISAR